jgi:hypothetical protein
MTGKLYYITTLGDWQRHAARFANSHWLALGDQRSASVGDDAALASVAADLPAGRQAAAGTVTSNCELSAATPILVLVEADEGAHLALEDDAAFEALPHPLGQKPISDAAQSALAAHGVAPSATTFDAAEAVARAHPLLRHRVF